MLALHALLAFANHALAQEPSPQEPIPQEPIPQDQRTQEPSSQEQRSREQGPQEQEQAQAEVAREKVAYAGADLNFSSMDALGVTYNPINMRAKVGVILFPDRIPVVAVESHFGFDVTDDSNTVNGQNVSLSINYYAGIYARATHEFSDYVSVYGLLGIAVAQLDGDTIFLQDDTQSSLSYGLGAAYKAPLDIYINLEIMQLIDADAFSISMASLGASYKF
ncbi:MAG TPA: porin family protein [Gammaproteobacteria bacterium]